ncbi:unnamed protein product, partial [Symbiodinium natans]
EVRHPRSLNFATERQVVVLREVHGCAWEDIRSRVRNLRGERPSLSLLKRVYKGFSQAKGRRPYKYQNCGRRPVKATKAVQKFLVQRLLALRMHCVCTSGTLQRELLAKRGVQLDESAIRKALRRQGYFWKRKYSAERRQERLRFARSVVQLSRARLREKLSFSMDGVLLSLPPRDPTDRRNYCAHGDGYMWRQRGEAGMERLAGQNPYLSQVPRARAVPLWGGLSEGGFRTVAFHKARKFTAEEWCRVVQTGKLQAAITALQPVQRHGPWKVLCDNEAFLHTAASRHAMAAKNITLWPVPASSPDLNPVEKFWAWLRRRLRHLDREDLRRKRPPIGMLAFKRALVTLLLALAGAYGLQVTLTRESTDVEVTRVFRRVSIKVHPDKGGAAADAQRLNAARDAWVQASQGTKPPGRPAHAQAGPVSASSAVTNGREGLRIRSEAVLLTYQSWPAGEAPGAWQRFCVFVAASVTAWTVKHWAATMEQTSGGDCHLHLMVQFTSAVDCGSARFIFEGVRPNASPNDYLGEGVCRKKLQQSINRGMFYVWADKVGTLRLPSGETCVAANYEPCWTEARRTYQVLGKWPEALWKQRKLTSAKYEQYLFLTRDGVLARKRNLDAVREHEFPGSARGRSMVGKTEWVKSLFKRALELKVGSLDIFPEGMRAFDRDTHDGIILDDVRDLKFIAEHQDKLQGKYDTRVEFATTPGGTCAYRKYLFAVPVAVTINNSTRNLDFLRAHDWLGSERNRVLVHFPDILAQAVCVLGPIVRRSLGRVRFGSERVSRSGSWVGMAVRPVVPHALTMQDHALLASEGTDRTSPHACPRSCLGTMPLVQEVRHPRSLNFATERQVVVLREVHGCAWEDIRSRVRNLRGERPSLSLLKRVYKGFSQAKGRRPYKYQNCGRRPVKATKAVQKFLVQRLLALRMHCVCTSGTLQRELLAKRGVQLDESAIRKALRRQGYFWLPKAQKRKYSAERRQERLRFARSVVQLSRARLREKLSFSMDGVLLSLPPRDPTDRRNYCAHGDGYMWRQRGEAGMERLAGQNPYPSQVPRARAVPLWGGLSEGGFRTVAFHKARKFTAEEWCRVVQTGKLQAAITALQPVQRHGPWKVLCDNEAFLHTAASRHAMAAKNITLWPVPASSPDLNPVEKFWAWLRRRLRHLDREDLRRKRPPIGMLAFKARVRAVLASQRAQRVASHIAAGFKKTCKEVVSKKGGMARS